MEGQTSAVVGTAKVGLTKVGQRTEEAGGLPQHTEETTTRVNPWTLIPEVTSAWTWL